MEYKRRTKVEEAYSLTYSETHDEETPTEAKGQGEVVTKREEGTEGERVVKKEGVENVADKGDLVQVPKPAVDAPQPPPSRDDSNVHETRDPLMVGSEEELELEELDMHKTPSPLMAASQEKLKLEGVEVLVLNLDRRPERLRAFEQTMSISYTRFPAIDGSRLHQYKVHGTTSCLALPNVLNPLSLTLWLMYTSVMSYSQPLPPPFPPIYCQNIVI